MLNPLKHKPVNWIDGMKISSDHFINTDNFIQDIVRDGNSLQLNNNNFGLLPPVYNETTSLDIQITERASSYVEVRINKCNAITAEGLRIDISQPDQAITFNHYFNQTTAAPLPQYFPSVGQYIPTSLTCSIMHLLLLKILQQ